MRFSGGILLSFSVMENFGRRKERFMLLLVNVRSCAVSISGLRPACPQFLWHLGHIPGRVEPATWYKCRHRLVHWRCTFSPGEEQLTPRHLSCADWPWPRGAWGGVTVTRPLLLLFFSFTTSPSLLSPFHFLPPSFLFHLLCSSICRLLLLLSRSLLRPTPFPFSLFCLSPSHLFVRTHPFCWCLSDFSWFRCNLRRSGRGAWGCVYSFGVLKSWTSIFL